MYMNIKNQVIVNNNYVYKYFDFNLKYNCMFFNEYIQINLFLNSISYERKDNRMSDNKQKLFNNIWKIADELRGTIDGWDFKNYVFVFLFYRYISENMANYINKNEDDDFDYSKLDDGDISQDIVNNIVSEKGFFIYPSELFSNVLEKAKQNIEEINTILKNVFNKIERSAIGTESENNVKEIFMNIDLSSQNLGETLIIRNQYILKIMEIISTLDLGEFTDSNNDVFGDVYEYLMGLYASKAGKSGGEYFTPQEVSKLLTLLAIGNKQKVDSIYDPACGSGSLLLQAGKILGNENVKNGYFGQESNYQTFTLCKMNMFLHNINFSNFDIRRGDTLIEPKHDLDNKYDVIVSNPPYSTKWAGKTDPLLINDERYAPAGILAPSSKSDLAFVMHSLYLLDEKGKAAIVCFPGIFYRSGAEEKIRKYLVDNNYIEAIIALPENLFYGTSITTNIMVMSKSKQDNKILFINASEEFIKETNQNKLTEQNINNILNTFLERKELEHYSKLVTIDEIANNNYDLSVSNYVESNEVKETIDIKTLNKEIQEVSSKVNELRKNIDLIIKEIDNE